MHIHRLFYFLIVLSDLLIACAPTGTPASQAQSDPMTLSLAVADAEGRPSAPYVLAFIEQVKTLSDGNITIEPIWDAGADTTPGFEQGVVKAVTEGHYDLGLAGSRAWDSIGVTSFQALQAPFLITNDALAEAVARSDIGTRMLNSLSSTGAEGLALWPEDLRHPFSVIPNKSILSPEDFEGVTVRVVPSEVSHLLIETLGGTPMFGDEYQAAESGLRQGFSLTGLPIATGNVVFFPKFQVLFANGTAFEKLNQAQQDILRQAATATQTKAIAEHPREGEAATAWCADGGTVVMATEEQVAAFEAAAQPVFARIEQDPLNAELITAIRELKAKTTPAPGPDACAPVTSPEGAVPSGDIEWSTGSPPAGLWRVELTADDFVRMGVLRSKAEAEWAGTYEFVFEDGKGTHRAEGETWTMVCPFTTDVMDDFVRVSFVDLGLDHYDCGAESDDVQWRLDADGLHFNFVANPGGGPQVELTAMYEAKPWQKVVGWSTGLPPNGVWQVDLSIEEITSFGALQSTAADMAGTYTWTFQDGNAKIEIQGPKIEVSCDAFATVINNAVRLQNVGSSTCDGDAYDDVQWRLDEDGLHFQLVSPQSVELKATYEAKPWQKVEEWSTGLPPNGVWQVDLTVEDFVQMGMLRSEAETEWAGLQTLTLKDGKSLGIWEGLHGQTAKCQANYEAIGDFVRFTYYTDTTECLNQIDEVQWRLEEDGLHFRVVEIKNAPLIGIQTYYEAKPWQKIADQ